MSTQHVAKIVACHDTINWYVMYRVGHEKVARLPFCTCPCDILSAISMYIRVFEELVNSRAVTMFPSFLWGHLTSTEYESNLHTIQELKDITSHALAAIKITLHRVYLNMIRSVQLCTDAGGNHFQYLLRWCSLSAFGYCINFCIYAMLRTLATFSWPTLIKTITFIFESLK